MRTQEYFKVSDVRVFRGNLFLWSQRYNEVAWLDSNAHPDKYSTFETLLAVDAASRLESRTGDGFKELSEYRGGIPDWIFGYLAYDLKNNIEALTSDNPDGLGFPDLCFFHPRKMITIKGNEAEFSYMPSVAGEIPGDFKDICHLERKEIAAGPERTALPGIQARMDRGVYLERVGRILDHIHRGAIYEATFCQEFYAEGVCLDAWQIYRELNEITRAPFAAFLRFDQKYVLSASPERFLKKSGDTLVSQPIKGTSGRSPGRAEDDRNKSALESDEKERAENIMIVDLVRNDLSKSAIRGTVKVEELCKVYSYQQVHQMISTITAKVPDDKEALEVLMETFPMGSMTGAPKISAMKIIENLEASKRGAYSGAIGYFTPGNDFDFSVVIRTILYNEAKKFVSFSVGSAITAMSVPEQEYEECLLKAAAMRRVLEV